MQNKNKFTFTVEVKGVGIEEVTGDLNKLSDTIDKLDKKLASSTLSSSLGGLFGDSEGFRKLFTDLGSQITSLAEVINKLAPVVEKLQEVEGQTQNNTEPDKNTILEPDKNTKPSKYDEQLKPVQESILQHLKKVQEEYKKGNEKEGTYQEELIKYLKQLVKNGGEKKEEKKDAAQQQNVGAAAQNAQTNAAKKEEEKKDPNALGGNFGLDEISLGDKLKVDKIAKGNGAADVEETRKKIDEVKKVLDDYNDKLTKSKKAADSFYKGLLKNYEKDSVEHKVLTELKAEYDAQYETKRAEGQKKSYEAQKVENEMKWGLMLEAAEKIKELKDKYAQYATGTFDELTKFFTASKEVYTEEANQVKAEITKLDAKLKESNDKKKALQEEEKTATGGRLIVIQEQLAREMQANEEMTKQKQELSKEEEKLRKQAEKEQKRSQRMGIMKQIVTSTADIATGIARELAKGIWGIPTAAIIAAQGAIQIATIKKQLEKINLEDGGLLRGRRHSQGGMRIEGTNIEVEGDEFVVNRESTRKNLGLIDYINRNRRELTPADVQAYYDRNGKQAVVVNHRIMKSMFEDGGQLTDLDVAAEASAQQTNEKLLAAIQNINFKPVVSVVDIIDAQRTVSSVENIAGI